MSYRTAIVEFYRRHPTATQDQARRATGAPKSKVRFIYRQLVAAGEIKPYAPAVAKDAAYGLPSSDHGWPAS